MQNWWQFFWTYETQIPDGLGFAQFGAAHLLWLALLSGLSILCLRRARSRRACLILGWSILAMEIYRDIVLLFIGYHGIYELPLHLCSLAGFFCFLHALRPRDWMGQVLYTLCLPGALAALLFPDWTRYPAINFMTIHGFLFHGAVVLYIRLALARREIVPDIKKLWKPVVFLCILVPPVYLFNKIFHANYLFINVPSPGSPLVLLERLLGNPGYLIGYAVLILLVMAGMDIGYLIWSRKNADPPCISKHHAGHNKTANNYRKRIK